MVDDTNPNINPDPARYGYFCNRCNHWHIHGASYSCGSDIRQMLIDSEVTFDGYHRSVEQWVMQTTWPVYSLKCSGCGVAVQTTTLYQKSGHIELWLCSWCEGRIDKDE